MLHFQPCKVMIFRFRQPQHLGTEQKVALLPVETQLEVNSLLLIFSSLSTTKKENRDGWV